MALEDLPVMAEMHLKKTAEAEQLLRCGHVYRSPRRMHLRERCRVMAKEMPEDERGMLHLFFRGFKSLIGRLGGRFSPSSAPRMWPARRCAESVRAPCRAAQAALCVSCTLSSAGLLRLIRPPWPVCKDIAHPYGEAPSCRYRGSIAAVATLNFSTMQPQVSVAMQDMQAVAGLRGGCELLTSLEGCVWLRDCCVNKVVQIVLYCGWQLQSSNVCSA